MAAVVEDRGVQDNQVDVDLDSGAVLLLLGFFFDLIGRRGKRRRAARERILRRGGLRKDELAQQARE